MLFKAEPLLPSSLRTNLHSWDVVSIPANDRAPRARRIERRDTSRCFELLLGRKPGQIIQQRPIPAVAFHRIDLDDRSAFPIGLEERQLSSRLIDYKDRQSSRPAGARVHRYPILCDHGSRRIHDRVAVNDDPRQLAAMIEKRLPDPHQVLRRLRLEGDARSNARMREKKRAFLNHECGAAKKVEMAGMPAQDEPTCSRC